MTRFVWWTPTSGSFAATNLIDAVGDASEEAHAGVLEVRVRLWSGGNAVGTGLMTITCALPGAPAGLEEGFTVIVNPRGTDLHVRFTEKTVGGPTLFHVLHERATVWWLPPRRRPPNPGPYAPEGFKDPHRMGGRTAA